MKKRSKRSSRLEPARLVQREAPAAQLQHGKLEEVLNFSNLTDFRNALLQIIPKLQENDLLRFVITKHGEPAAVVMSFAAYQVFKGAAARVVEREAKRDPDAALREAYQEMTGDELDAAEQPADVSTGREIPGAEIRDLHQSIRKAVERFVQSKLTLPEQK